MGGGDKPSFTPTKKWLGKCFSHAEGGGRGVGVGVGGGGQQFGGSFGAGQLSFNCTEGVCKNSTPLRGGGGGGGTKSLKGGMTKVSDS